MREYIITIMVLQLISLGIELRTTFKTQKLERGDMACIGIWVLFLTWGFVLVNGEDVE